MKRENEHQFECDGVTVHMCFAETGESLQDKLTVLLQKCQNQALDMELGLCYNEGEQ